MGRNSKYWEKRLQKIADSTFEKAAETAQERYKRVFDIAAEQINNDVTELYSRILADGEVTPLSIYKKKRYSNLKKNIKQMARDMGVELNKETEKILTTVVEDAYTSTNSALDISYDRVPKEMVDQIVNSRWSGDNYSKRIWDNVETLATQVEKNVVQAVLTGKNKDDCVGEVMKRFGTSFSNADRLIRTEVMHSINDAQGETYKKAGYTKYRILIEHDERLCEVCEALANQEFDFDDKQEGVNCPPLHPNCRCTIVPVLDLQKEEKADIMKKEPLKLSIQFFASSDVTKQKTSSIRKGLKTYERRIKEHEDKIAHPEKYVTDPKYENPKYLAGLKRHWAHELKTFKEEIAAAHDELKKRGEE